MIVVLIVALIIGAIFGAVSDELLRGGDPRSTRVIVAGIAGAIVGLVARRASGGDGVLIEALTALVGALALAFVMRVRVSAVIARLNP